MNLNYFNMFIFNKIHFYLLQTEHAQNKKFFENVHVYDRAYRLIGL